LSSKGFDESKKEMASNGSSSSQSLIVISSLHVNALVVAAVDKAEGHWKKERRSSRLVGTTIQEKGALWPLVHAS